MWRFYIYICTYLGLNSLWSHSQYRLSGYGIQWGTATLPYQCELWETVKSVCFWQFVLFSLSSTIRQCTDDIVLKGIQFKKDVAVLIPIYNIQHDPDIWPDPETFDPER